MAESGTFRVALVDDHNLFRTGLASLLSSRPNLQMVGEAADGNQAVEMARRIVPDLILMDIHMPVCDGIEALKIIKNDKPQIKIVMLSASDADDDLFTAIKSGADGYLLKNLDPAQLFDLIERVRGGEAPISGGLAARILREFKRTAAVQEAAPASGEPLTPREIETLELLATGQSNKQIADTLHITQATVKLHLRNVMEKLHFQNRVQLAVYAATHRLNDKPGPKSDTST